MTQKWTNTDAGPRQCKNVQDALSKIARERTMHVELTGVIGDPDSEHRSTYSMMVGIGVGRDDVAAAMQAIGEQFDWTVTKANHQQIIEACAAALPALAANRPVNDKRETPEVVAERNASLERRLAAEKAKRDAQRALIEQVEAKTPKGAAALIVAELKEDTSDIQSDYHGNNTVRCVAIGFRYGAREDFRQLRAVAGRFADTAHLGLDAPKDIEQRDNHSMGRGNYLSDHGWDGGGSGWVVRSRSLTSATHLGLTEVALSDQPDVEQGEPTSVGGVTISPSSIGREGVVEIRFDEKPDPAVISSLKAHRFRWARGNRCWYGSDVAFANSLLPEPQPIAS